MLSIVDVLRQQVDKGNVLTLLPSTTYFNGLVSYDEKVTLNYFLVHTRFPRWLILDIVAICPPTPTYIVPYYLSRNEHFSLSQRVEFASQFLREFLLSVEFDSKIDLESYSLTAELLFNLSSDVLAVLDLEKFSLINPNSRCVLTYINNVLHHRNMPELPSNPTPYTFAWVIKPFYTMTLIDYYILICMQHSPRMLKRLAYIITTLPTLNTPNFITLFEELMRDYNSLMTINRANDIIRAIVTHKDFSEEWLKKCRGKFFGDHVLQCICQYRKDLLTNYVQERMFAIFRRKYPYYQADLRIFYETFAQLYTAENFPDHMDVSLISVKIRCKMLKYLPFTSHHSIITAKWFADVADMFSGYVSLLSNPCYPASELAQILLTNHAHSIYNFIDGHYSDDKLWLPIVDQLKLDETRKLLNNPISSRLFEAILRRGIGIPWVDNMVLNPNLSLYTFSRCTQNVLSERGVATEIVRAGFLPAQIEIEDLHHQLRELHAMFSELDWDVQRQVIEIVLCEDELYWRRYRFR